MITGSGIKFGTDGWRAVIADRFTFDNVALVGTAIHHYLDESGQTGKPLLIGYDNRFSAEHYAAHLANYLHSEGRQVVVMQAACPTPVTAFGVQHLGAAGAVMLTASHNPYYYQGLKFIPHFAGPAMPETTDRITALIGELAPSFVSPRTTTEWGGETINLRKAYFDQLDTIINPPSIASLGRRLLFAPLHGTGTGFLDGYLRERGVDVVTIGGERDVLFGSGLPDPNESVLKKLQPALERHECFMLAATDGDADRFALMDREGGYYGANQLLPLLAEYLLSYRKLSGPLVRTVCTSHLLDAVAREHGLELIETRVGFKYVGDELRRGALIGGEESGGLSIKGHIPEKDGILATLLVLELIATSGEELQSLLGSLHNKYGDWRYRRLDLHLPAEKKSDLLARLESVEHTFLERKIARREQLDGTKFIFEDGSWIMVRASGTEDVLRIYMEAPGTKQLQKLSKAVTSYVA